MKKVLIGIVTMLCVAGATGAGAAPNKAAAPANPPLTEAAYEAAKARISQQYQADGKACARLEGNRQDVCEAQAEGRQKAERAKLEARFRRDPETILEAKVVTAEANYAVDREQCDALKGKAQRRCIKDAKAAREAALRQARVEKVKNARAVPAKDAAAQGQPAEASKKS